MFLFILFQFIHLTERIESHEPKRAKYDETFITFCQKLQILKQTISDLRELVKIYENKIHNKYIQAESFLRSIDLCFIKDIEDGIISEDDLSELKSYTDFYLKILSENEND